MLQMAYCSKGFLDYLDAEQSHSGVDIPQITKRFHSSILTLNYNHGQKSLGQSERNFNSLRFTSSVAKSSAVFLQIHVPSPLPTQYNVERSKELCLDGFNTVCGVGEAGRDVQC